ncbi:hypothetical protein RJZ56_007900 [Blastomyces dermatitidis]|uniref:Uncharacterized protein n=3 Tax=Blastomyces TaxID=229219 RepID=A0A179UXA7_BLAGS|nr:uncharacterized protein BDBG_07171 [Blastomyces gilchristii SLH14081]XP_045278608.1 uncharacterized protein BDCG_07358 [Blastomyces dermatitidis ER-3]EGE82465.1 hypothetical protein BDDG_05409 [Blastomyces dermatitidis ATCC 18188]EQL36357.1 hypothetical protein BDFG_02093 [Blastomyces dermatitidis ATCC 26199]EEQ92238.1 hypothetical protein BDCG_07358 [Blastomyces dermatitidis ER-3]OAT11737.1 hypothetical protein BDBG_07171 [Blastomyces gilchristii SLH14081]
MCLVYAVYAGCGHKIGGEIEPCPYARYPDACAEAKTEDRKVEIMCTRCRKYYGCDYTERLKDRTPPPKAAEYKEIEPKEAAPKKAESKEAKNKEGEGKEAKSK